MSNCFWCQRVLDSKSTTRDHLIPQWACRLFYVQLGQANDRGNVVKACASCNTAKGGMPPATYFEVRVQPGKRKPASEYWHKLQDQVCTSWTQGNGQVDPQVKAFIIEEMLKSVPGYERPVVSETHLQMLINPPFSKNKSTSLPFLAPDIP